VTTGWPKSHAAWPNRFDSLDLWTKSYVKNDDRGAKVADLGPYDVVHGHVDADLGPYDVVHDHADVDPDPDDAVRGHARDHLDPEHAVSDDLPPCDVSPTALWTCGDFSFYPRHF
jgi:hypothetical protein